jgi:hypothetical protein
MTPWKEAPTILQHTKGDYEMIRNWRPISITNCPHCVFTCLLAQIVQDLNTTHARLVDPQKGFIKKTNECHEQGIMLNKLFLDARRYHKGLAMITTDFSNASGSVPHELILPTMR